MIYLPGEPQKEITLEIKTVIIEEDDTEDIAEELTRLLAALSDADDEDVEELFDGIVRPDERDDIVLMTEAHIETDKSGNVVISYVENADDVQMYTDAKIVFHPSNPRLVIMSKSGAMNTFLSFEEGKTHICTYETPFMPFKIYVESGIVDNRLLDKGTMKLNYVLNVNDTPPQRFFIDIKIKDAPEDTLKNILT